MPDIIEHRLAAARATIRLVKRLAEYYTTDEMVKWFESPQPLLNNALPADLIAAGRDDEIHALFDSMDAGTYI